jgi:hypothetical protein
MIEVEIIDEDGSPIPIRFVVFRDHKPIMHLLSDSYIEKIDKIIHDYCAEKNGLH